MSSRADCFPRPLVGLQRFLGGARSIPRPTRPEMLRITRLLSRQPGVVFAKRRKSASQDWEERSGSRETVDAIHIQRVRNEDCFGCSTDDRNAPRGRATCTGTTITFPERKLHRGRLFSKERRFGCGTRPGSRRSSFIGPDWIACWSASSTGSRSERPSPTWRYVMRTAAAGTFLAFGPA
jgi:hypothetical protein